MSRAVWKFPLPQWGAQDVDMPRGAKVLHVDRDGDQVALWALVDTRTGEIPARRRFHVANTGDHLPDDMALGYVGSARLGGDLLVGLFPSPVTVLHVFELTTP